MGTDSEFQDLSLSETSIGDSVVVSDTACHHPSRLLTFFDSFRCFLCFAALAFSIL